MSSPQEPRRPLPPQPGHEPAAGQPAAGQPPGPYPAPPGPYPAPPPGPYAAPPPPEGSLPYGQPHYGGPGQPPPRKRRKALWIGLGIAGGVLLLVAVGVVILVNVVGGTTNRARGLADEFNRLIIAGDVDSAYGKHMDPALQRQISRAEFAAGVEGLELDDSCKPDYSSLNVSSSNGLNAADVAGSLKCDTKTVELAYRFEGRDELKMVNIRLRPQQ